jgi:uncharacterized damage-inducible protein DinB
MTWIAPTPAEVDGPLTGDDRPMLEGYLNWQRTTLLNICAGLTGEQLALRPLPSSNLSLLGLVRHMAKVERTWFRIRAAREPIEALYDAALGKDHDFDVLAADEAPAAFRRYRDEWQAAEVAAASLSFDDTLDTGKGQLFSLRMVYVHMIGEYSRHNGHADLLREAIDGVTGR